MNYLSVSGGADSTAMALLLWERGEDFEMVFSDTGAELPDTYFMLPLLSQKVGKKLHVVNNGTFFQWLLHFEYMLPSPFLRWCTRILKQKPLHAFSKDMAMGIRADEPRRIKGRNYPLVEAGMAKKDVLDLCRKYDLLNPVYSWRSNVSCFCCPFQRKGDWLGLWRNYPELYRIAEQWEEGSIRGTRFGWHIGYTLKDLRTFSDSQIKLWPDPEEEPCLICTL